jgi:aminoglycoside phosphotransferase (APT) family kinase protein
MPEKTHTKHLDIPLVRRLLKAQFPQWADLPIRPVEHDGWDNRTFRLGDSMSVRLPSNAAYEPQVAKEHEWLPKLAPQLPLPIPVSLAMGEPSEAFPMRWSVRQWVEGEIALRAPIDDLVAFAEELADFLVVLQRIHTIGGPAPGQHSYFRGCSVTFDDPSRFQRTPGNWAVRESIANLGDEVDAALAIEVWEAALAAGEPDRPVWVHGDVAPSNLLVVNGRLSAVIDWGCSAFGDPACDLGIAWTFFSGDSREAFRERLSLDRETWARARGWALWVPLYRLADLVGQPGPRQDAYWRSTINEIFQDHARYG